MQLFVYEAMKSRPVCEHSAYYLSEIYRMKTGSTCLVWINVYVKTALQANNPRGNLKIHQKYLVTVFRNVNIKMGSPFKYKTL